MPFDLRSWRGLPCTLAFCRDSEESLDEGWHVIVSLEMHEAENAQFFSRRSIPRDCETNVRPLRAFSISNGIACV